MTFGGEPCKTLKSYEVFITSHEDEVLIARHCPDREIVSTALPQPANVSRSGEYIADVRHSRSERFSSKSNRTDN